MYPTLADRCPWRACTTMASRSDGRRLPDSTVPSFSCAWLYRYCAAGVPEGAERGEQGTEPAGAQGTSSRNLLVVANGCSAAAVGAVQCAIHQRGSSAGSRAGPDAEFDVPTAALGAPRAQPARFISQTRRWSGIWALRSVTTSPQQARPRGPPCRASSMSASSSLIFAAVSSAWRRGIRGRRGMARVCG